MEIGSELTCARGASFGNRNWLLARERSFFHGEWIGLFHRRHLLHYGNTGFAEYVGDLGFAQSGGVIFER